jgi:hypothetical protein
MDKIFAAATAAVVILAVVAAFVTVPYVSVILLLLGVVTGAGISLAGKGSDHLFIVAIVLTVIAERLANVPDAGATLGPIFAHLGVIFGGVGMSTIGASATVIGMGMIRHLLNDWRGAPAAHGTTAAAE